MNAIAAPATSCATRKCQISARPDSTSTPSTPIVTASTTSVRQHDEPALPAVTGDPAHEHQHQRRHGSGRQHEAELARRRRRDR